MLEHLKSIIIQIQAWGREKHFYVDQQSPAINLDYQIRGKLEIRAEEHWDPRLYKTKAGQQFEAVGMGSQRVNNRSCENEVWGLKWSRLCTAFTCMSALQTLQTYMSLVLMEAGRETQFPWNGGTNCYELPCICRELKCCSLEQHSVI